MQRELHFSPTAWDQYLSWQLTEMDIVTKINELLKDCKRNPFTGLGKPEPLKNELKGFWSRRITKVHRLVYKVTTTAIEVVQS